MLISGLILLVVVAFGFLPGETFRLALQHRVRGSLQLASYRITDSPDVGIPARLILGLYLLAVSTALLLLARVPFAGLVPDPRQLFDGSSLRGHEVGYVLTGVVGLAVAALLGAAGGVLQGRSIGRRLEEYQEAAAADNSTGLPALVLPWSRYSEPWMQALLAFRHPNVIAHLDLVGGQSVAGRLVAADLFTSEKEGRGILLQPLGVDGRRDPRERVFLRTEDVKLLIASEGAP